MKDKKEVEFDYEVDEELYRETSEFEKILGKKIFYGDLGFNVHVDTRIFLSKKEAQEMADYIQSLPTRVDMGGTINPLEAFALEALKKLQG